MIYASVSEVSVPIATAMITTIVSFIPVFAMQGQEGKLFSPLAYTKTYVLGFAFLIGIVILPTIAYLVFAVKIHSAKMRQIGNWLLVVAGVILAIWFGNIIALGLTVIGVNNLTSHLWKNIQMNTYINLAITLLIAVHFLADEWLPLGPERGFFLNILFVALAVGAVLAVLWVLVIYYERILRWSLSHRTIFLLIPFSTIVVDNNTS